MPYNTPSILPLLATAQVNSGVITLLCSLELLEKSQIWGHIYISLHCNPSLTIYLWSITIDATVVRYS